MAVVAVGLGYAILGKLSSFLSSDAGYASPVWPAAGLALAAVLIYGNWVSIGVFFGSYITNLFLGGALDFQNHLIGFSIGIGAALQALVGAYLIRRFVGFPSALDDMASILRFFFLGALLACLINSSVGVIVLLSQGVITLASALPTYFIWWIGDTLGVITFTPVILALAMKGTDIWTRRKIPIFTAVILSLGVAVLMFLFTKNLEQERIAQSFQNKAHVAALTIFQSIDDSMERLSRVHDFISVIGNVSGSGFKVFTKNILAVNVGLSAISWNDYLLDSERESYEKKMRDSGMPEFRITDRSENGTLVTSPTHPKYVVVSHIEPLTANKAALGFNVYSDKSRRAALEKSRITGKAVMTERIFLVQGTSDTPSVLVFYPTSNPGEGAAGKFKGFVTGVFHVKGMVANALSGMNVEDLDITIIDRSAPTEKQLLYSDQSRESYEVGSQRLERAAAGSGINIWNSDKEIATRRWQIIVRPTPQYFNAHRSAVAWFILLGGVVISALITLLVLITSGRHRLIKMRVDQQTAELKEKAFLLHSAKIEAERANQAKSDFLSLMSHDLRTPLNAIMGFSEMMHLKVYGELGDSRYDEYVDDIYKSGGFLVSLVNDILDVSKIEAGKYELNDESVDVCKIVQSCIHQLEVSAAASSVQIINHTGSIGPQMKGDSRVLTQLLNNVLSNAVKFTNRSGRVDVRAEVDDMDCINLVVSDTGIGMSSEQIKTALKPFEQVNPNLARENEGTGLGLHLCTNFMNLFGGDFELDSQVGVGTAVRLRFPSNRTIHRRKIANVSSDFDDKKSAANQSI